jgi:hypothetical protein
MTEWFTNILNREQEVIYNAQGQPMTSTPEDFFNLIHLQASTLRAPGHSMIRVKESICVSYT